MAGNIYREKSLKRISSPEELDRYVKISNPGTWIVLSIVLVLLVSILLWGFFGNLTTTKTVDVIIENGQSEIIMSQEELEDILPGMKVQYDNKTVGSVSSVDKDGNIVLSNLDFENGIYQMEIVVEEIRPIYFILN